MLRRGAVLARRGRFIFRRNIITMFMSIEMILNAVNLTSSLRLPAAAGGRTSARVLRWMVVAAAEARRPGDYSDRYSRIENPEYRRPRLDEELTPTDATLAHTILPGGFLINGLFRAPLFQGVVNASPSAAWCSPSVGC